MKINFGTGKGVHVAGCPYSCCKDGPEVTLDDYERRLLLSNNDQLWIATKLRPFSGYGRYEYILGFGPDAESAERASAERAYRDLSGLRVDPWDSYQNAQWRGQRHLVVPATDSLKSGFEAACETGQIKKIQWDGYRFDFAFMPNPNNWFQPPDNPDVACTIAEAKAMIDWGVIDNAEGIEVAAPVAGRFEALRNKIKNWM